MPSSVKFNPLTTRDVDKALKAMEYDMAKERVEPYIVDMSKELPEVLPLISISGSCLCSVGNISAVCGEAKSRKTFLTSGLVASAMAIPYNKLNNFQIVDKNHDLNVLWVDTEQGEMHVRKVVGGGTAHRTTDLNIPFKTFLNLFKPLIASKGQKGLKRV